MNQELAAVAWSVLAFVLLVSVTATFAEMLFGRSVVPAPVRELNGRHGWPGARGIRSKGAGRVIVFVTGSVFLALIGYVDVAGLIDPTIRRTSLQTVAVSAHIAASLAWIGVLAYRRRRDGDREPMQ